jgi:hypothetical protein
MTIRVIGAVAICMLGLTGCRHVEDSEIVARFKAAGGGNPDQANASQIGAWFSKHDVVRKQLTPSCAAKRKGAPADWVNTDEGKICAGLADANFFAPAKITSDHVAF